MKDRGGVRIPVRVQFFFSLRRLDWFWGPTSLLPNGYRGLFSRGWSSRLWSWPLTSILCRNQEYVVLYIHSSVRLHDVVLNYAQGIVSLHRFTYQKIVLLILRFFGLLFHPDDGDSTCLSKFCKILPECTVSHTRRQWWAQCHYSPEESEKIHEGR
jgi:hypothetical protein